MKNWNVPVVLLNVSKYFWGMYKTAGKIKKNLSLMFGSCFKFSLQNKQYNNIGIILQVSDNDFISTLVGIYNIPKVENETH